jgi:hypothetical protein
MLEEHRNILTVSSLLDEQAMSHIQSQQSELLDKIVNLRATGVGGLVELPQITVCGNQSSEKKLRVRFPALILRTRDSATMCLESRSQALISQS